MYYSTIKTPLVIAAGFAVFLVANIVFLLNICYMEGFEITGFQLSIIFVVFSMEIVFIIYSTSNFIRGLKELNPGLLFPWLVIKVIEIIIIFLGTICLTWTRVGNTLIFTGFVTLLIGLYIVFYICTIYKKMTKNSQIPYIIQNSPELEHIPELENRLELDYPPSYEESQESHQNQAYNTNNKY